MSEIKRISFSWQVAMTEINKATEIGIWKLMNEQEAGFFGGVLYHPIRASERTFAKQVDGVLDGVTNNAVSLNEIDAWEQHRGKSLDTMHLRSRVIRAQNRSFLSIVWSKSWIGLIDGLQNLKEKLVG